VARKLIDLALFAHQLLLDPLEASRQPFVPLVLGVDDPLLMRAENTFEVGELLDQTLDEPDRGFRPLVVEFV
jgi:hypothetical protein